MGRLRLIGFAAGAVAISAAAFAAQGTFSGGGDEAGRVIVQLPPSPPPAGTSSFAAATPAAASFSTTVGGFTYDWTALQAAIDTDTEVPNGYFIVGNATDPGYLFAYQKGAFGIDRVTPLASASKWFAGTLAMRMAQAGIVSLEDPMRPPLAFWTTTGTKKDVRLKHALSMTSGFNANPLVGGC